MTDAADETIVTDRQNGVVREPEGRKRPFDCMTGTNRQAVCCPHPTDRIWSQTVWRRR